MKTNCAETVHIECMAEAHVRQWRWVEATVVAALWRRAWASANPHIEVLDPLPQWLQRVHGEFGFPQEVLVLEWGGQVRAFMVFNRTIAYIGQLFVDVDSQRQGFGRVLLDAASIRMRQGWSLHVAASNHRAQTFYVNYGLVRGIVDEHPTTGRQRVMYSTQIFSTP